MLGVSLVSDRPEEILYVSLLEPTFVTNITASHQSIAASAVGMQIDCQLEKKSFPVVLRPNVKSMDISKPFLTFNSVRNLLGLFDCLLFFPPGPLQAQGSSLCFPLPSLHVLDTQEKPQQTQPVTTTRASCWASKRWRCTSTSC